MTIINDNQPARPINSLPEDDQTKARAYIQGAVYCWCKNQSDNIFAVRDLFGGDNTDWGGTPLQPIYDHHCQSVKDHSPDLDGDELHRKAAEAAAIDVGWLTKSVLQDDRRNFESSDAGRAKGYRWVDND